jgi:hypothetical protein
MSGTALDPRRLADLESIRRLRARYCRCIDTKQWGRLRTLFADDARFEGFASAPSGSGPDVFVAGVSKRLGDAISVHQCHMPDIVFTGDDEARGVWAMFDYLEWPDRGRVPGAPNARGLYGFGHYEETYRRIGGAWKFAFLRLTRLRIVPLRDDHPAPIGEFLRASTDWLPDD